jgi:hypothetical protein
MRDPMTGEPRDLKAELTHYPFQLRPGVMVFLYLPADLTGADVARLRRYLETLVLEDRD